MNDYDLEQQMKKMLRKGVKNTIKQGKPSVSRRTGKNVTKRKFDNEKR